jgi:hypothetical protein
MTKQRSSGMRLNSASGGAAAAPALAGTAEGTTPSDEVVEHEEIARLAQSYWEARGCQGGSPEEDWYRAEQELKARRSAAAK